MDWWRIGGTFPTVHGAEILSPHTDNWNQRHLSAQWGHIVRIFGPGVKTMFFPGDGNFIKAIHNSIPTAIMM